MFCLKCGKEQLSNPRFCRSCGQKLEPDGSSEVPIGAEPAIQDTGRRVDGIAKETPEEYCKRARSLLKENRLEDALECINEGSKRGADDDLMRCKGEVLSKLGRLDEALGCYNSVPVRAEILWALFFLVALPVAGTFLIQMSEHVSASAGLGIVRLSLEFVGSSLAIGGICVSVWRIYQSVCVILRRRGAQRRIGREKRLT